MIHNFATHRPNISCSLNEYDVPVLNEATGHEDTEGGGGLDPGILNFGRWSASLSDFFTTG